MKFSKKARAEIIQYIQDSMKPIEDDETLPKMQIAGTDKWSDWRRIRMWLMDILEGSATLIGKTYDYDMMVVKLKYEKGLTWRQISDRLLMPESTLKDRTRKFFNKLVDDMPAKQGSEILWTIKRLYGLSKDSNEDSCELSLVTEIKYRWAGTVDSRHDHYETQSDIK